MRKIFCLLINMGLSSVLLTQSVNAQIKYTVTPLVTITGLQSEATAINSLGVVVGNYTWRNGVVHNFLNDGAMHDLGMFVPGFGSQITGINDLQIVIGSQQTSAGWDSNNNYYQILTAFKIYRKQFSVLSNDFNDPKGYNNATGINNASHIVGNSPNGAWIWINGTRSFIPNGLDFYPRAINNLDQIVGANYINFITHAALYSAGKYRDLGALVPESYGSVQSYSYGLAINDEGQAVGVSRTAGLILHAVIFNATYVQDIDTLSDKSDATQYSQANGINKSGRIVGTIYRPGRTPASIGFVYAGGIMQDVNSLLLANSHWVINTANAINDSGEIVGGGTFNGKPNQAYLLTQVK
jgi:probable HAF family extracellular repeat protein